jgi:HAD superfamily hydrolase (TIGR01509 family)
MTPSPPAGQSLGDTLDQARCLLIDFDGPICDIYAGVTDAAVAARLRKIITGQGITAMPAAITSSGDPIAVFDYAATISPELGALVEAEMTDQEVAAVATARPVPYVHEVVTSARAAGRLIAIVSNNSDHAVRTYLSQHGLADRVDLISARTSSDPALLKPSPHLLNQAITGLSAAPAECVIIGDSVTDIQAARIAGIASIGYANKPGKHDDFTAEGATAIVTSLADLVLPLRARPLPN